MRVDAVGRFGAKMGEYEKDQEALQHLWDELMSDEEPEPFLASSSDSYDPPRRVIMIVTIP